MKRIVFLVSMIAFSGGIGFAQSAALQNQFVLDKNEMASHGYTLVDEGGGMTNSEWVLTFDEHNYKKNYRYYVIVYLEGCSSCDPASYFHDKRNDLVKELNIKIQRASGVVQGTVSIKQDVSIKGDWTIYSQSKSKVYTYGLLFKKNDR